MMKKTDCTICSRKYEWLETVEVGDTITFGKYNDRDIEWIAQEKKNGNVCLISKYVLDIKPLDNALNGDRWLDTGLRHWLNNEFYGKAFTEEDRGLILTIGNGLNGQEFTTNMIMAFSEEFGDSLDTAMKEEIMLKMKNRHILTSEERKEFLALRKKTGALKKELKQDFLIYANDRVGLPFRDEVSNKNCSLVEGTVCAYWVLSMDKTSIIVEVTNEDDMTDNVCEEKNSYGVRPTIWVMSGNVSWKSLLAQGVSLIRDIGKNNNEGEVTEDNNMHKNHAFNVKKPVDDQKTKIDNSSFWDRTTVAFLTCWCPFLGLLCAYKGNHKLGIVFGIFLTLFFLLVPVLPDRYGIVGICIASFSSAIVCFKYRWKVAGVILAGISILIFLAFCAYLSFNQTIQY